MSNQVQYIDLFAGCGGISLGLFKAGLTGLFAIESNPNAFQTFKHNLINNQKHFDWPDWLTKENWDINQLLNAKSQQLNNIRGCVDIVVGGPPCQGFSLMGDRRASDTRNELFNSYLEFIKIVRPQMIMFENVRGFTLRFTKSQHHTKVTFSDILLKNLDDLGYKDARGEMVDLSKFGVPQRRHRFIVIATLDGRSDDVFCQLESGKQEFLNSKGIKDQNSSQTALSDLERKHGTADCPDTRNFLSGKISDPENDFQKYLQLPNKANYIPDSHRFVNHRSEIKDIFRCLLESAPRNRRIYGDERTRYGVKKRNITVLDPEQPSLTITTIPDDFVHYSEPRVMTVRECARLQTFPDSYEFKGPYTTGGKRRVKQTPRYTQVGNAVPPLFAEQLGLAMKKVLNK